MKEKKKYHINYMLKVEMRHQLEIANYNVIMTYI